MRQKIELFTDYIDFSHRFLFDFTNPRNQYNHSEYGEATLGWDRLYNQVIVIKRSSSNHHSLVAREFKAIHSVEYHPKISLALAYGQRLMTPHIGFWDYLAMPYYAEGNLRDYLRLNECSSAQILSLTKSLLEGIASLHRQHNIHGFLNPSTIWISHDDQNELISIVGGLGAWSWMSLTYEILSYTDPERARRNELVVTVPYNVDLWNFGVILYELTTGQHPFSYDNLGQATLTARIVERNIPDLINGVSEPYQAMIRRCLLSTSTDQLIKEEDLLAMLTPQP